jgi:hypothetical protein
MFVTSGLREVLVSTNGHDWALRYESLVGLGDVAFGNGRFVAVGETATNGVTLVSPDGQDWTGNFSLRTGLSTVVFGVTNFVAADVNGSLHLSSDGLNWETLSNSLPHPVYRGTYAGGLFVLVGGDTTANYIYTSRDGRSWTIASVPGANFLRSVNYGNGRFVAVAGFAGLPGVFLTSTNGQDWIEEIPSTNLRLNGVAFANGMFVAAGESGSVFTSTNGLEWALNRLPSGAAFTSASYGFGRFIITESPVPPQTGASALWTSYDAVNWTRHATAATQTLSKAAIGANRLVVVGGGGLILTSELLGPRFRIEALRAAGGKIFLPIQASPSAKISLERSSDLRSWSVWTNSISTTENLDLTDSISTTVQFYRFTVQ